MKVALVTGITGQDGSYLTEILFKKGYRVVGAVRNTDRALDSFPSHVMKKIELIRWDMLDQARMVEVLNHYQPSEFYNLAAYSSGEGMFDDAIGIGNVNGLAVTRMLESVRQVDNSIRFCQASSSEMFGDAQESPQSEDTGFNPRSPYGVAKLYAHTMLSVYRQRYGLFACSAILFNHESPRRKLDFVTRKITHTAAKIKLGMANELRLGNLDARRDWGFAKDYAQGMWSMLQMSQADDYVLASGETHSVQELCECAFEYLDLDYRDYVSVDSASRRHDEKVQLVGDASKARRELGWQPQLNIRELVHMMVDADIELLASVQADRLGKE